MSGLSPGLKGALKSAEDRQEDARLAESLRSCAGDGGVARFEDSRFAAPWPDRLECAGPHPGPYRYSAERRRAWRRCAGFAAPAFRARARALPARCCARARPPKRWVWPMPILDARLMEQNWGRWEGLTRAEILARDGEDAFTPRRPERAISAAGRRIHRRTACAGRGLPERCGARRQATPSPWRIWACCAPPIRLATGWDMATPMPAELDVSKALILEPDAATARRP